MNREFDLCPLTFFVAVDLVMDIVPVDRGVSLTTVLIVVLLVVGCLDIVCGQEVCCDRFGGIAVAFIDGACGRC